MSASGEQRTLRVAWQQGAQGREPPTAVQHALAEIGQEQSPVVQHEDAATGHFRAFTVIQLTRHDTVARLTPLVA